MLDIIIFSYLVVLDIGFRFIDFFLVLEQLEDKLFFVIILHNSGQNESVVVSELNKLDFGVLINSPESISKDITLVKGNVEVFSGLVLFVKIAVVVILPGHNEPIVAVVVLLAFNNAVVKPLKQLLLN